MDLTHEAMDDTMHASDNYRPMVSHAVLREMAEEKVLQDMDLFSEFVATEVLFSGERHPWGRHGFISTHGLVKEVLMKPKATEDQIASAWREIRQRFLDAESERVSAEFERLLAIEESGDE
jgi:hypothetical protein